MWLGSKEFDDVANGGPANGAKTGFRRPTIDRAFVAEASVTAGVKDAVDFLLKANLTFFIVTRIFGLTLICGNAGLRQTAAGEILLSHQTGQRNEGGVIRARSEKMLISELTCSASNGFI